MATQQNHADYFIGSRHFGAGKVHPQSRSLAYFCPTCGDIWGRAVVHGATEWDLYVNSCERHKNTGVYTHGQPPGCFLHAFFVNCIAGAACSPAVLSSFPPALIKREFDLTMNHFLAKEQP